MSAPYPRAVAEGWLPLVLARSVKARPLSRTLMDCPLVVFRGADGRCAVLVDRCPHRNAQLSQGRLRGGEIECPYHGWRFDPDGRCTLTPGAPTPAQQGAQALPAVEFAGVVWTTLASSPAPFPEPPLPIGANDLDSFWWEVRPSRARLLDALENLLDPAHPHFLHAGIVRSSRVRQEVQVTVRTARCHAEAVYVENARASALMPRLLEGFRATSIGRAFPPCTGQISFEGPDGLRLAITVVFTPETPERVRPFAHFATPRGRAPAWLKEALLRTFHIPVLAQDQVALRAQADNIVRFGGPRYATGPLDFLGPAIQALADGRSLEVSERSFTAQL